MTRLQIRVYGDPFAATEDSRAMRALIAAARRRGSRVAISMTAARGDDTGRPVILTDGVRTFEVCTALSQPEIEVILECAQEAVASSAPLIAFGSADDALLAGLEFPDACMVSMGDRDADPDRVIDAVDAHMQTWPLAVDSCVDAAVLEPVLGAAQPVEDDRCVLHVCSADDGDTRRVVERLTPKLSVLGWTLRLHDATDLVRECVAQAGCEVEFTHGAIDASVLTGVRAVCLPGASAPSIEVLAVALASGRPLISARFGATAGVLGVPGVCLPIAGRIDDAGVFVPDDRTLERALARVATDLSACLEIAQRARRHVVESLASPRPSVPLAEARPSERPLVVLEAPLFETSSSAHLTIETARALVRRDHVDVLLRPTVPFRGDLEAFTRRAPELVSRLTRRPPRADLWLSSGWPPRTARPDAATFALRIDQEYGALPTELTPHVTEEADRVVVHSSAVRRVVTDAGSPPERIATIPHGVDGSVFHDGVVPCPRVLDFKGARKAVLFVGGLIWRKGIDVVAKTMLETFRADDPVCLVVKSVGTATDYHGYHLAELVERMQKLPSAIPVLTIEDELEPSELAAVYRACDVLFHPYRGEGFGLPVLEARACGLPVVVTDGGSTDDFCTGPGAHRIPSVRRYVDLPEPHEGRPFVLEPDAAACPQLLIDALSDAARRAARDASRTVREERTWDASAAALECLAHEAVERAAGQCTSRPFTWKP